MRKVFPVEVWVGRVPGVSSDWRGRNPSRRNHDGVDLMFRAESGDPPCSKSTRRNRSPQWYMPNGRAARATEGGIAHRVEERANGWAVYLRHAGGHETVYRHLEEPLVGAGETVQAGQRVGLIGPSDEVAAKPGIHPLRHLHFEVRTKKGEPLDPVPYLLDAAFVQESGDPFV